MGVEARRMKQEKVIERKKMVVSRIAHYGEKHGGRKGKEVERWRFRRRGRRDSRMEKR